VKTPLIGSNPIVKKLTYYEKHNGQVFALNGQQIIQEQKGFKNPIQRISMPSNSSGLGK
jgi:hypothetical protein